MPLPVGPPSLRADQCLAISTFCTHVAGGALCVWGPAQSGKSHCIRWCLAAAGLKARRVDVADAVGEASEGGRVLWCEGDGAAPAVLQRAVERARFGRRVLLVEMRLRPPAAVPFTMVLSVPAYTARQLLGLLPEYLEQYHPEATHEQCQAVRHYVASQLCVNASAVTYATLRQHAEDSVCGGGIVPDAPPRPAGDCAAELALGLAGAFQTRRTQAGKVKVRRGGGGRSRLALTAPTPRCFAAVRWSAEQIAAAHPVLRAALQMEGGGLGTARWLDQLERRGFTTRTARGGYAAVDPDLRRLVTHARRLGVHGLLPPS
eukprot:TRINITY_DN28440_c0_g1_i1.p1 TRINITY_DN28440_c0_g1~~TRINITY_DN28440_c0_g1_i1.p1  ORF type:complete len:318 (+),score=83.55 TRINITY_DN28440_c0_g1_i1:91-1044(+)